MSSSSSSSEEHPVQLDIADIEEQPKRGRARKYNTDEEKKEAKRLAYLKHKEKNPNYKKQYYADKQKPALEVSKVLETDPMKSLLMQIEHMYRGEYVIEDCDENRALLSEAISKMHCRPKSS